MRKTVAENQFRVLDHSVLAYIFTYVMTIKHFIFFLSPFITVATHITLKYTNRVLLPHMYTYTEKGQCYVQILAHFIQFPNTWTFTRHSLCVVDYNSNWLGKYCTWIACYSHIMFHSVHSAVCCLSNRWNAKSNEKCVMVSRLMRVTLDSISDETFDSWWFVLYPKKNDSAHFFFACKYFALYRKTFERIQKPNYRVHFNSPAKL